MGCTVWVIAVVLPVSEGARALYGRGALLPPLAVALALAWLAWLDLRARHVRVSDTEVVAYTLWKPPTRIAWSAVERVHYVELRDVLRLVPRGGGPVVCIPNLMRGFVWCAAEAARRAPADQAAALRAAVATASSVPARYRPALPEASA
jgi:hypothetical protein